MAPQNSPSLGILSFVALVILVVEPYRAFGSSRGNPFRFITDDNSAGMCASAVIVHGYKCQEFEVTTDDGYILSVQRIPKGRGGGGGANRPPVLLQHGVLVVNKNIRISVSSFQPVHIHKGPCRDTVFGKWNLSREVEFIVFRSHRPHC
nr:triacylglycerol lipase 2 isoform X1 [Nicotiana tomentosiformis]